MPKFCPLESLLGGKSDHKVWILKDEIYTLLNRKKIIKRTSQNSISKDLNIVVTVLMNPCYLKIYC